MRTRHRLRASSKSLTFQSSLGSRRSGDRPTDQRGAGRVRHGLAGEIARRAARHDRRYQGGGRSPGSRHGRGRETARGGPQCDGVDDDLLPGRIQVITTATDGSASLWDGATGELLGTVLLPERVTASPEFASDGHTVVIATDYGSVYRWTLACRTPACSPAHWLDATSPEWSGPKPSALGPIRRLALRPEPGGVYGSTSLVGAPPQRAHCQVPRILVCRLSVLRHAQGADVGGADTRGLALATAC
jgi:hypothetical protein